MRESVSEETPEERDSGVRLAEAVSEIDSARPETIEVAQAVPDDLGSGLLRRLYEAPYAFDFFQATRLLHLVDLQRRPVGRASPPNAEAVRFRSHLALSFPPSMLYDLERPREPGLPPVMTVSFMGLTGPSGVLPRHYTEMLLRLERETKGPERRCMRDWFEMFNHRLISLFYRAWEKYRFYIHYERKEYERSIPDPFTLCLYSFCGMGVAPLRNRLRVTAVLPKSGGSEKLLARIDDLVLLRFSGLIAQRPKCVVNAEALLNDYFDVPVRIKQFQGQWLRLDPSNLSRLGESGANNLLGVSLMAGERVWDVRSKIRIRLGPMSYEQFKEFLPDKAPIPRRKAFFLLNQLLRLYLGPELDFDAQLVLKAPEVPPFKLSSADGVGPRLGWNTWTSSKTFEKDVDDAVFQGVEVFKVSG